MRHQLSIVAGVALLASGCSASMPPAELVDANAAYDRAAAGPAAQLDPAQLHVAHEQLVAAQHSFDEDGPTYKTRDQAYIAERKAELADVQARTLAAEKQASEAVVAAQATQAKELQVAQAQVIQTRARLAAATAAMAELSAMKSVKNVKEDDRGVVITLSGSVLFASSKYELLPSAQEALGNVAATLAKNPDSRLLVHGYTDSQGPLDYNLTLSRNRAESVRAFLASHGIAADRITAQGFGPANPVANNDTAEGRANNRRVEIVVQPAPAAPAAEAAPPTTTTAIVH